LSQSSLLHSKPKSTVGTPAYIAPEVLSRGEYDGKVSALICSSLLIIALQLGYLTIYCTLFLNLLFASTMLVCCASLLSDTLWLWRWLYRSSPSVWKHHLHWHVAPVLLKFLPCGPASWNPSKSVVLEFWNFVLRSSTLVGREWSWPHMPGLVCYPYLCREIPNSNFQVQLFVLTILSKKHGAWGTACLKKSSFYVTGTFFFHVTCLMLNFALVGYACFSCMHGF